MMRLPDVTGQPRLAEAAGDWQREIVAALFGSLINGRRMVKKPFVLVPKKNSKTTGSAAIMLTAMLLDEAPRQAYLIFGPSHAISQLAFDAAKGMIEADPVLAARFHVRDHIKTIVDQVTKSTLKIQTFDSSVATGVKPKGILIDELHELGKVHYAERVMAQLSGGLVSRPDGFMVIISTQSDQQPAGVFKQELDLARSIRDGKAVVGVANATLPVLYEFPEEVQTAKEERWLDPRLWSQVLPNLGKSVFLELLEADCAEAKAKGESAFRIWASQHLNIEIGLGLHAQRWRGADHWLGAAEPDLTLEELLSRCEVAVCGVDGGGLDDLFGVAVLGRERGTGTWLGWARAWVQRDVVMAVDGKEPLRKDIAPRLLDFEREGTLVLCDSATQDIEEVTTVVQQVKESGLLPDKGAVGIDPLAVGGLVDALTGIDLTDDQLVAVGQGFKLSSAVWSSERKLRDGTLRHDGSDMMAWCVGNAKAEQRGNAVYITKEAAGKAKIDPLCALFNAVKLMERNPVAGTGGGVSINDWIAGMRAA